MHLKETIVAPGHFKSTVVANVHQKHNSMTAELLQRGLWPSWERSPLNPHTACTRKRKKKRSALSHMATAAMRRSGTPPPYPAGCLLRKSSMGLKAEWRWAKAILPHLHKQICVVLERLERGMAQSGRASMGRQDAMFKVIENCTDDRITAGLLGVLAAPWSILLKRTTEHLIHFGRANMAGLVSLKDLLRWEGEISTTSERPFQTQCTCLEAASCLGVAFP